MDSISFENQQNQPNNFQPHRIIFMPVDESIATEKAIRWVLDNLATETDLFMLVHVRPCIKNQYRMHLSTPYAPNVYPENTARNIETTDKNSSYSLLMRLALYFAKKKYHVRVVPLVGDVREELELKIATVQPTMVVMSNRGLSSIGKLFLGSVTKYLANTSKSPILIIPK